MSQPVDLIAAANRQVSGREHRGKPARVVTVTRIYRTTVEDLWDAVTNPGRIPRWFLPVSGDLRLGGRYQCQGNAGGEITRCEPPRRFEATWEYGNEISWIAVDVSEASEGRAQFRLEHIAHVDDARWAQYGPGAVGVGWDLGLMGLGHYLEGGAGVSPEEGMAWLGSAAGKDFVRRSSEDWGRASIDSGTLPASANAAAARTTAFYTGEPEPVSSA